MDGFVAEYFTNLSDAFLDPRKRVFVGYLAGALAIAALAALITAGWNRKRGWATLVSLVLSPRIWWSRSARADYALFAINQGIMLGLAPRLLSHLALATLLFEYLHGVVGAPPAETRTLPAWVAVAVFTVGQFVLDDAARYGVHRLLHRVPVLWAFHKVHHSAETLTPITVFRTHPMEGILFTLRSALVQGVMIGACVFFFGDKVDLATVLGANVFIFLFNAAGSNLRHSHVPIRYGRVLEGWLISPAQHQIHHSTAPEHFDRNFGAVLAVWDRLGGTLHRSEKGRDIRFGLSETTEPAAHGLARLYFEPIREATGLCLAAARTATTGVFRMMTTQPSQKSSRIRLSNLAGGLRRAGRGTVPALLAAAVGLAAGVALAPDRASAQDGKPLDIYSHRQPFLIEPFIEAYREKTGVEVNVVYASKGLAQRLMAEGERSPADLILTVDIGRLSVYADQDLLAPVQSDVLAANIPEHLRAPDDTWFALSKRARLVVVSADRVEEDAITRIEDLADETWKGRVCSRPGSHVYNRALMASIIAAHGEEKAEEWARAFRGNLARRPQGNDRAQIKAIHQGECDVAIVNHYYWGKLKYGDNPEQREWADSVRVVFTNQDGRGNHINISGGGVAKHSDNKEGAVAFLEFLSGATAQQLYGTINFEYPVNPNVEPAEKLKALGAFKEDDLPIARIAELAPTAQRIIDRVGW